MSRRTIAIAAALSVLALGSPLITGCTNPLATQYFNQGVEKYDAGNYQGAIDDWSKAIEINPQDAYAYYKRGIAKELVGDLKGACADWKEASSLGDKDAAGWVRKECQFPQSAPQRNEPLW